MLIDAHLHLQDPRFDGFVADIVKSLREAGVGRIVINGTGPADWDRVEQLSQEFEEAIPFFGLHPWKVENAGEGWADGLRELLERNPGAGVGEIGLDKWIRNHNIASQRRAFLEQLEIACHFGRPAAVHCLQAWGHLLECLDESPYHLPFLLHSFGGPAEMVGEFVKRGAWFSLSGYFFRPDKAAKLEVFDHIPAERILLESDAPDMMPPPEMVRQRVGKDDDGEVNHPVNLVSVYEAYAARREIAVGELAVLIQQNFEHWYGPPTPAKTQAST